MGEQDFPVPVSTPALPNTRWHGGFGLSSLLIGFYLLGLGAALAAVGSRLVFGLGDDLPSPQMGPGRMSVCHFVSRN